MLSKQYRLPIQSIPKKDGRTIKGRYFLFKVFPNDLSFNRFGIIISKKVAKKSTERNRLKRLMFNALKDDLLPRQGAGNDFLIIVSPNILKLSPEEIKKELKQYV